MLNTLQQICENGSPLLGVDYALFDGNPGFITAVSLRFPSLTVVFRAVPDDDTLAVSVGKLQAQAREKIVKVADSTVWQPCLGMPVEWAWQLTNHEGYADGVRLAFGSPDVGAGGVVELVVTASAIRLFVVTEGDAATNT